MKITDKSTWFAGLQWFFFIFANIVVIPITVGQAFGLSQGEVVPLLQMSFIVTGLACLLQAFWGHGRPILEGQSGLWWGVFLTLATSAAAQGSDLGTLGGSLAIGVILSGIITVLIGVFRLGPWLAKLFTDRVMGVFMFLLGLTLIQIFFKGMLGIPFGTSQGVIQVSTALLSIFIVVFVIILSLRSPVKFRSYAILIGIIVGWLLYSLFLGETNSSGGLAQSVSFFPLGAPVWQTGIIMTAVLTGILNTSNTFGALKGTDDILGKKTEAKDYRTSFTITGFVTMIAGVFALVPYAPFVSSIGYLRQTNIYDRLPFVIGSLFFLLMGVITPLGAFFAKLPLSIGSAVLFVAYIHLFTSAIDFLKKTPIHALNVYRVGIPIFVGAIIMTFPVENFASLPQIMQPFLSNGLLVGILLALILDNLFKWQSES